MVVKKKAKEHTATIIVKKSKKSITKSLIFGTIIAAFLLSLASSALWVNKTVFNSEEFTKITTDAILSESSTNALARSIVDTALEDRPLIRTVIRDPATRAIAGLIASDRADAAITKIVEQIHGYVTSPNPQNVEFELSGIKSIVTRLIDLFNGDKDAETTRIDAVPDTLVLIDADTIPSFYHLSIVFLWLGPIALIGALLLLAAPYIKRKGFDVKVLAFQGLVIVGSTLITFLVGPLLRPPFLGLIADANYRTITGNIYDVLIASFNTQTLWLFSFGLIMVVVSAAITIYRSYSLRRASAK